MKSIICYLSYSGNTEEIAEILEKKLVENNHLVEMYAIGSGSVPDLSLYDKIFMGTFTWDMGGTPEEMEDFISEVGCEFNNVYVFGSGDTQFGGDELFCKAVDNVLKHYRSSYEGLKIEQSPRGSQVNLVNKWIEGVLKND